MCTDEWTVLSYEERERGRGIRKKNTEKNEKRKEEERNRETEETKRQREGERNSLKYIIILHIL